MKVDSLIKNDELFLESKRELRIKQTADIGHARLGRFLISVISLENQKSHL
jgi:hypothetical protein